MSLSTGVTEEAHAAHAAHASRKVSDGQLQLPVGARGLDVGGTQPAWENGNAVHGMHGTNIAGYGGLRQSMQGTRHAGEGGHEAGQVGPPGLSEHFPRSSAGGDVHVQGKPTDSSALPLMPSAPLGVPW